MKRRTKRPVTGGMRVRAYAVLRRAVEEGVAYGWRRAHKHTDAPGEEAIIDQVVHGVRNEVCEYFDSDPTEEASARSLHRLHRPQGHEPGAVRHVSKQLLAQADAALAPLFNIVDASIALFNCVKATSRI